ncbi:uncharacterized protein C1orf43 homolog [Eurytemora carolleeae]|uniref:uncharacterized protein C1orf43 homolog n=1 Tax=Eurytemora carolleeae TaxID=1294199 RepID=UPI000C762436|nr:uncharacterized protein C1orf43 homolog [Eurytemora carolleeae]|eukprot:XP_023323957.1 uncharacterized protein C1orf43 homolog [Eurytemora affinis]
MEIESPPLTVPPQLPPQQEQLSGVAVVIIIGIGVQTIIILFIFSKRQINRFSLRGRRGPHVSVGQGGLKPLRKEIDRRIEYAAHIRFEPRTQPMDNTESSENIRFRVAAVDRVSELDRLLGVYDPEYWRPAGANLRSFLIDCLAGPLVGIEPKKIHSFCDLYEAARHSYKPFLQQDLDKFIQALQALKSQVTFNTSNKPTTPKKGLGTPVHRRAVNRPRRRLVGMEGEDCTVVINRNSSTVLLTVDSLTTTHSTSV